MDYLKKVILTNVVMCSLIPYSFAEIASVTASTSMIVEKYAAISGLDDITLTTSSIGNSSSTLFVGSSSFHLETNCMVHVSVAGSYLKTMLGRTAPTTYSLNGTSSAFNTSVNSTHSSSHSVEIKSLINSIWQQRAGDYSSNLTITVSILNHGP